jgi:hypothetical protein
MSGSDASSYCFAPRVRSFQEELRVGVEVLLDARAVVSMDMLLKDVFAAMFGRGVMQSRELNAVETWRR